MDVISFATDFPDPNGTQKLLRSTESQLDEINPPTAVPLMLVNKKGIQYQCTTRSEWAAVRQHLEKGLVKVPDPLLKHMVGVEQFERIRNWDEWEAFTDAVELACRNMQWRSRVELQVVEVKVSTRGD